MISDYFRVLGFAAITSVVALAVPACGTAAVTPLAPGYVYGIDGEYFYQYTPSLQLVSSESLYSMGLRPDTGPTGGAISGDGMFLTEAYVFDSSNNNGLADLLVGIGPGGTVERSIQIPDEAQQIGDGIGVDPLSGTIYGTWTQHLYKIAPDFSSETELPITFGEPGGISGEAGGVAVSSNGTVYVVDSSLGRIDVLNSTDTGIASTIPAGTDPLGLAFGPDGTLYYTDGTYYGNNVCQIMSVDLATGTQTVIASGLPGLTSLSAAPDGSLYAAANGNGEFLHFTGGTYQYISTGNRTDGIAPMPAVPEPSSVMLAGIALVAGFGGRRGNRTR